MRKLLLVMIILFGAFNMFGCTSNAGQSSDMVSNNITIGAAASLREALSEVQVKFENEKKVKLAFNFASSGAIQRQIEQGAPVDLFISAGKKQMDALESKNLIDKESRKNFLTNKLVLIAPKEYKDKIKSVSDLVGMDVKISIGEPESVPAGTYAKESLTYLKLWDKLSSKIVYAKDVKQVVSYVEKGEVAAGIVYNSDAIALKDSSIVQIFDEKSHETIIYPAAIVSESKNKESVKMFLDYLSTTEAKQIFSKYGFDVNIK